MTGLSQHGIYLGDRGTIFKKFIRSILQGKIKDSYVNYLTSDDHIKLYGHAFTSDSIDPVNNYQVYEQHGDLSGNKFIVTYMYQKFPQLQCSDGVKVVARLRIVYGAKQSFSELARKLGFWNFISVTADIRQRKMKALLEDVFEAFLGVTEYIIDNYKRIGVGYAVVYDILTSMFDKLDISLQYEDLYDAKTRLKELLDIHEHQLGTLQYTELKHNNMTVCSLYLIKNTEKTKISEGIATIKADAQQYASTNALKILEQRGFIKSVPDIFKKLNHSYTESLSHTSIIQQWGPNINQLSLLKDRNKYQVSYQLTPLAFYCRKRNLHGIQVCLDLQADPNISDSDGMYCADLLLIGKTDELHINDILQVLFKVHPVLNITKTVFNMYVKDYIGSFITSQLSQFHIIETSS